MTNTGGKPKYLPPIEEAGKQGSEKEQSKDKTEKTEEKKVKEFGKTQKSIRNLILAFIVGFVSFLPAWFIMFFWGNIPMPEILESKTLFPIEDWNFWSDLIVSLVFSAIVLLAANSVAEEKNKWTNGISWALLLILFCWTIGYYGFFRKVEPRTRNHQTVVYDPNPFRDQTPIHSLYLDKGEKSFWIDWKVGYKLDTWGNYQNYKLIYEDGSVVTVRSGEITYLPDPKKNTRIRLESLSDDQTIYVYRTRI
jgi:hypothetical protein